MKSTLAALLLLVLTGCEFMPHRPDVESQYIAEISVVNSWFEAEVAAPTLNPIRSKMTLLGTRNQTFEMLANRDTPSEPEKAAILSLAYLFDQYLHRLNDVDGAYGSPYREVTQAGGWAIQAALAELSNGAITYGDYAKRRLEIKSRVEEAERHIENELVRRGQTERALNQQAAFEPLCTYAIQQQTTTLERSLDRPIHCQRLGSSMDCR
jgi:hypothetical protein